jgi:hypothetical protein
MNKIECLNKHTRVLTANDSSFGSSHFIIEIIADLECFDWKWCESELSFSFKNFKIKISRAITLEPLGNFDFKFIQKISSKIDNLKQVLSSIVYLVSLWIVTSNNDNALPEEVQLISVLTWKQRLSIFYKTTY